MINSMSELKRRWIRPLPERLINKIAAGEVIERPAAVLKELVENSIDAGAGRIDVIVEKSGAKKVIVIDDGCGINAEQVEIAFSRHATSKISDFKDLEKLLSFGFRGEALPSIGSVSKTRMITRTTDSDTGTEIIIEGGVVQSVKPVAAPVGTKVEVSDLFYNTPARRKFLKAESTEARHLTKNAVGLALSAPDISFSYTLNGKKLFSVDKAGSDQKSRVCRLLLGQRDGRLLEVISQSAIMNIRGYLSHLDKCRQNQHGLYIFINDRYIKSQTMVHAITAGYGELLPKGSYPIGAVFLDIDPAKVDVNVHPTKAEVRLSEERQVHDILYQAVKRSLRECPDIQSPGIMAEEERPKPGLPISEAIRRAKSFVPTKDAVSVQTHLKELYGHKDLLPRTTGEKSDTGGQGISLADFHEKQRETKVDIDLSRVIFLGQISDLYLLFKADDALLIIDQHTAHERVLYEENLKSLQAGRAISQSLLFPINIELSPDRFALYEESSEILKAAGFVVEPFGTGIVLLSSVPSALSKKSPEKVFLEIMEDVENMQKAGQDLKKAVIQSIACRGAVMAGDRLNEDEALTLLKQLFMTDNRHCCPHGRPTVLKISKDELDAKFKRK